MGDEPLKSPENGFNKAIFCTQFVPNQQKSGKNPKKFTRNLVPLTGLEPVRSVNPMDFKSIASACSTTVA